MIHPSGFRLVSREKKLLRRLWCQLALYSQQLFLMCSSHILSGSKGRPEQGQVNAHRVPLSLSKKHQPMVYVKSSSSACVQLFWSFGLCMQLFPPEFCVNTEQSFKVTQTQKQLQKIKLAIAVVLLMPKLVASPVLALKMRAWANLVLFSTITKWEKNSTRRKELICFPKPLKTLKWLRPN